MQKKLLFQTASNFIAAFTIVMLVLAALPVSSAHAATSTDTYSTAGTFTWTAPAGVTSVTVQVWGGGGRGGSISGGYGEATGGGGGGGAYSSKTNIAVTPGNGYTVVVGAGSNSTSAGGNSYFINTSTVLARGGNSATSSTGASGGATATGVGDTKYSGGGGASGSGGGNRGGGGGSSAGTAANGATATNATGATAPSGGGNGGDAKSNPSGDGTDGSTPGGAGGGAYRSGGSSSYTGGSGADGKVVITYTTLLDQTISVTTHAPGSASNGTSFNVVANSSSGLLVTITTTGVCSGGDTDGTATITMTSGTGTCTVHYNQAGNGTYNPASEVTEDVTATAAVCYTLTLSSSANGGDPIANPVKSTACASNGQYVAGEIIGLTASPDAGYRVAGWTGTNNDFSLSTTNAVTMPASARTVSVSYDVVSNKTYYVDNTNVSCSDSGTGLTQAAPFCTIGKGASIAARRGYRAGIGWYLRRNCERAEFRQRRKPHHILGGGGCDSDWKRYSNR